MRCSGARVMTSTSEGKASSHGLCASAGDKKDQGPRQQTVEQVRIAGHGDDGKQHASGHGGFQTKGFAAPHNHYDALIQK